MKAFRKDEAPMSNNERLAILETTIININSNMVEMKDMIRHQSDKSDAFRIELKQEMKHQEDKFDRKFDSVHNRLWFIFIWLLSAIIGLAGVIAHAEHWF